MEAIDALACAEEGNILPTDTELYTEEELECIRNVMRVAVLYALGYLYEHREEADHHAPDADAPEPSLLYPGKGW